MPTTYIGRDASNRPIMHVQSGSGVADSVMKGPPDSNSVFHSDFPYIMSTESWEWTFDQNTPTQTLGPRLYAKIDLTAYPSLLQHLQNGRKFLLNYSVQSEAHEFIEDGQGGYLELRYAGTTQGTFNSLGDNMLHYIEAPNDSRGALGILHDGAAGIEILRFSTDQLLINSKGRDKRMNHSDTVNFPNEKYSTEYTPVGEETFYNPFYIGGWEGKVSGVGDAKALNKTLATGPELGKPYLTPQTRSIWVGIGIVAPNGTTTAFHASTKIKISLLNIRGFLNGFDVEDEVVPLSGTGSELGELTSLKLNNTELSFNGIDFFGGNKFLRYIGTYPALGSLPLEVDLTKEIIMGLPVYNTDTFQYGNPAETYITGTGGNQFRGFSDGVLLSGDNLPLVIRGINDFSRTFIYDLDETPNISPRYTQVLPTVNIPLFELVSLENTTSVELTNDSLVLNNDFSLYAPGVTNEFTYLGDQVLLQPFDALTTGNNQGALGLSPIFGGTGYRSVINTTLYPVDASKSVITGYIGGSGTIEYSPIYPPNWTSAFSMGTREIDNSTEKVSTSTLSMVALAAGENLVASRGMGVIYQNLFTDLPGFDIVIKLHRSADGSNMYGTWNGVAAINGGSTVSQVDRDASTIFLTPFSKFFINNEVGL